MIDPTEKDIGRRVTYTGNYGGPLEYGKITSFNDYCVFVKYDHHAGDTSQATSREDLIWQN